MAVKYITDNDLSNSLFINSNDKLQVALSTDINNLLSVDTNGELISLDYSGTYLGLTRNGKIEDGIGANFNISPDLEVVQYEAGRFSSKHVLKSKGFISKLHTLEPIVSSSNYKYKLSYQLFVPTDYPFDKVRDFVYFNQYDPSKRRLFSGIVKHESDKMTLTQDVSVGDTIIHVDNNLLTSNDTGLNDYEQELKFDYVDNGVDYKDSFYSRKQSRSYGSRNIDFANSTSTEIHLKNTCVVSALAGTRVWQSGGGGFIYLYQSPTISDINGNVLPNSNSFTNRLEIDRSDYGKIINVSIILDGRDPWTPGKYSSDAIYIGLGILPAKQIDDFDVDGPLRLTYRGNFSITKI